jgi:hypothetical protein
MSNQNEDESAIRARLAPDYERVFEDPEALNAWMAHSPKRSRLL